MRAFRVEITDIDELVRTEAADLLGGLVAAVAGGIRFLTLGIVGSEDVLALHPGGDAEAGGGEREGREVDLFNQVGPNDSGRDARAADDERDMGPFFVEELLAAGVADAVVGHEHDQRIRQLAFLFKAGEHAADVQVGQADGIEVIGPVLQEHRISRVIRR